MRRKSAQLEASVVSTNCRCKAASVCSLSQTSRASQRSRKWRRCGSDKLSLSGSGKAQSFGELCTIRVSIGRSSCSNKVCRHLTAYSGNALCGSPLRRYSEWRSRIACQENEKTIIKSRVSAPDFRQCPVNYPVWLIKYYVQIPDFFPRAPAHQPLYPVFQLSFPWANNLRRFGNFPDASGSIISATRKGAGNWSEAPLWHLR